MLNYGNYHGKCMIINKNSARYNRQLYDYDTFTRPPKYKYLCVNWLQCLPAFAAELCFLRVTQTSFCWFALKMLPFSLVEYCSNLGHNPPSCLIAQIKQHHFCCQSVTTVYASVFNNLGSNQGPSGWNAGDLREAGGRVLLMFI